MRVDVVGSSGTYPTATNPASGYLITQGGTRVWCDTGPGTFIRLPVASELVDAVFISHRHPDHCLDVFMAYHAWTYVPEPREGIRLYASGDVLDHLAAFTGKSRPQAFGSTFELIEVAEGDRVDEGDLSIEFFEVSHSVPALGTRWTGAGRNLFYTGDTGPGDWVRHVDGSDVFLCEAALVGPRKDADMIHHLNPTEAGEIARNAGVEKLVLTHVPPHLDLDSSISEAEVAFDRPVVAAVAGSNFRV